MALDSTFLPNLPIRESYGSDRSMTGRIEDTCPALYQFVRRIEGYNTNLKGHHWHGYNYSAHKRIDDFNDSLSDMKDTIMEVGMDIYGITGLGFTAIPSENWDIMSLVNQVMQDVTAVHQQLDGDPRNIGINNEIEQFLQDNHQIGYLLKLALREGGY